MKKIIKLIAINVSVFIVLIICFEGIFILNAKFFNKLEEFKSSYSQTTIERFKKSKIILAQEMGADIFDEIPEQNKSKIKFDEFKNYKSFDSALEEIPNRPWTFSPDGKLKTSIFTKKVISDSKIIYQVSYTRDSDFSRYVENQQNKLNPKNFILSIGDSFTFGDGVDQGFEYESVLAKMLNSDWKIYNRGINGDGPNDFYMRNIFNPNFLDSYTEENGVFIWIYIDAQLRRVFFPSNVLDPKGFYSKKPDMTFENGTMQFNGEFRYPQRPIRKLVYFLNKLEFIHFFNIEIPKIYTAQNFDLFFNLLDSSLKLNVEVNKKIKKKLLIVYQTNADVKLIKEVGKKYAFDVIDIEPLVHHRDKKFNGDLNLEIPLDGHPTSEGHWLLAKVINNYLKNNFK